MNLPYSIKDSITQCGIKVYLGLWTICPMQKGLMCAIIFS